MNPQKLTIPLLIGLTLARLVIRLRFYSNFKIFRFFCSVNLANFSEILKGPPALMRNHDHNQISLPTPYFHGWPNIPKRLVWGRTFVQNGTGYCTPYVRVRAPCKHYFLPGAPPPTPCPCLSEPSCSLCRKSPGNFPCTPASPESWQVSGDSELAPSHLS